MKHLHPRAVWLFFIQCLMGWFWFGVIIGIFLYGFSSTMRGVATDLVYKSGAGVLFRWFDVLIWFSNNIWLVVALLIVLSYVCARLAYHFYRYELTDIGFKKESGIIWKKYVTIPYERIQNVDIYRGVFARILGLSDLHIQTAGMSGVSPSGGVASFAEGRLPGLGIQEAEMLRDEVARMAKGNHRGI